MQLNTELGETALLRAAADRLRDLLPATWTSVLEVSNRDFDNGIDAFLTVAPPKGAPVLFVVQVKRSTERRSIRSAVDQLAAAAQRGHGLVVTDYANPALRERCHATGLGYLDLTGWVHLRADDAGLFVSRQGSARPPVTPGKRGTAMVRLDGPGASQLVRTLWAAPLPVGVRELAEAAGVSPGTAAKVLPTLAAYGALERNLHGSVVSVDRRLLVDRWVQDYGVYTTNPEVRWCLDPRGPDHAVAELAASYPPRGDFDAGVGLTGYLGAVAYLPREPAEVYPVVPHTLLAVYSADPGHLAAQMRLRAATPTTANVVLIRPRDSRLLERYPLEVPVPQVVADLLTMGGRFPELAEQLLQVLATTDPRT